MIATGVPLIDEDAHLLCGRGEFKAAGHEVKNRFHLLARQPIVKLYQFIDGDAIFEFTSTADTGMRVSLNTHAPLTLPGTLSTA